ncbi:MAG: TIGR03790 family protein [Verrucomicrobia bacterium]|nr:TIGR03790 family protein [Verrucomicrobiota bacterium]MDE3099391.1 TIGR03790 family protein [Verrucomicrobiota bacterium]
MKRLRIGFVLFAAALAPVIARANGNEVVVIYNRNMPGSKSVAEHYADVRHVPENRVFGFSTTTNEVVSRTEYVNSLQEPLLRALRKERLWRFGKVTFRTTNGAPGRVIEKVVASKIRYAVLCYGIPLKIAEDPSLHQPGAGRLPTMFRRNEASVDSELAWLPMIRAHIPLDGPLRNWCYGVTNAEWLDPTNGILLVARLDGPTAAIAEGLVDKALQAGRQGLWGRAYFDARGLQPGSEYYLGDRIILGAAGIARALGYETVVDDQPATFSAAFPMSQIAIYAGWYDEDVSGPFSLTNVEFMPGAFAYHLHSYSAATVRGATTHWVGPLLARGVTCTMGCVDEPSLQFTPDVALFLARFSVAQFTFGEAAWAAQPALSWQTTVVGDPLYRPFGKTPDQLDQWLLAQHSPLLPWSILRVVNLAGNRGVPKASLIQSLKKLPLTAASAVLTEKLADLCDAAGQTNAALDFYQKAIILNPSPEQKIRLRLAVAGQFEARNDKPAVYDDLQKLLTENPAYPGRFDIMKRLLNLAIAMNNKTDITRCVREMKSYTP